MPTKFDEAFAKLQKLAAIFEAGKDHYLSGDYQEADARKDFIDKFFFALGWDVNHDEQTNPYAQEVKVERGVNEGSTRKRADYAFFLSPNYRDVRFYVEAKRPSKDFGSADNCHQAIRYGWFTKRTSPFSVLTSFEDFYILDCRLKPNINDTLSRVVERFSYTDYIDPEKFARIYWLFSREAVASGSLEKFAENRPVARGKKFQRGLFKGGDTQPDEDFLEELDSYRQQLAQAFKRANLDLDGESLTEVTQRTLDRLVFTRFLEDRGIEAPVIENFGKADGFWEDFVSASLRLNRKYNGVVYKEHPKLDVPGFKPDEKVFARICEELTDPTSPYNFNVIPIHILGSIYERFLGKIISDGARVVEKPEVRKAGGVYYTPEYIVRYIVENTVGKMIEGKTPDEISKLKFADIACGSGSFLLGVYDVLLKYHAEYYSENPGKVRKGDCVRRDGTLHLSLQKKRDILTNNLYGVDIDRQAVEVAQLSLYLKLLEDETVGTTTEFQDEFHFTLLPSLDKNIVCGNSLIGPDIADGCALTDEEEKKINPLDYAQRFPAIFRRRVSGGELREAAPGDVEHNVPDGSPLHGSYGKVSYKKKKGDKPFLSRVPESEYEGGFDAIVGNPPYLYSAGQAHKEYFQQRFEIAEYQTDFYVYFVERAIKLLKQQGVFGMIVSDSWIKGKYFAKLRDFLFTKTALLNVTVFDYPPFDGATIENSIVIVRRDAPEKLFSVFQFDKPSKLKKLNSLTVGDCSRLGFIDVRYSNNNAAILAKIETRTDPLGKFCKLNRGVHAYRTDGYGKSKFSNGTQTKRDKDIRSYHATNKLDNTYFPEIKGKHLERYNYHWDGTYISYGDWLAEARTPEFFFNPKLAIRKIIAPKLVCTFIKDDIVLDQSVYVAIQLNKTFADLRFVLGILSSSIGGWYIKNKHGIYDTLYPWFTKEQLSNFPIVLLDLKNPADKSRHDRLVELVEQMLAAKAKLPTAKTERDREFYTNKCATLDQQIDALVYELYDLSEDEIKIVENKG